MAVGFKNKKGIFFTLIAILMVTVFFAALSPRQGDDIRDEIPATQTRMKVTDNFITLLRTAYIPTAMRTSSYNALVAISEYQKSHGLRFENHSELQRHFAEVMINGSMDCGTYRSVEQCICNCTNTNLSYMKNKTLTQRLRDIVDLSNSDLQIRTNFSYRDYNVSLSQDNDTGPFQVRVNATVNFTSTNGLAWWNFTETYAAVFNVEGIEDPLYSVESRNVTQDGTIYTNRFVETNVTVWNATAVFEQIDQRKYAYNPSGTSVLTRFTVTNESSPCCGVESFINTHVMNNSNVTGKAEKSFVDWCFFGDRCPEDRPNVEPAHLYNISCITNASRNAKFYNFRLDVYSISRYNLTQDATRETAGCS